MKAAKAGTDIASDAAIVEESPVTGGVGGHTRRITQKVGSRARGKELAVPLTRRPVS
jgi:hypothetical protein